jgi:serine/threonine-protein kinase RsbW
MAVGDEDIPAILPPVGLTSLTRWDGIQRASMSHYRRQSRHVVHLEFSSVFGMLDLVQVVGDHIARELGLDDESIHWTGVAIRESIINAIKHGNRSDASKRVFVEFETDTVDRAPALIIRVRDQGAGFDPATLADPMAPENLLKASGRGIFLIRSFMDEVALQRAAEGGMEIVMVKRAGSAHAELQQAE